MKYAMKYTGLSFAMVVLLVSCTTEKHKAATQNNKLVAVHGEVVKAITELDAAKKDNARFVTQLENTIKVIKNQNKELAGIQVLSKLQEVKTQLETGLTELEKGYSEVLELFKNEKYAEAKTRLEAVEKGFQEATRRLQELQTQVARTYDIPITEPPIPSTPPAADMPANTEIPGSPTADMPASTPTSEVPAADMPSDMPNP